MEKGRGAKINIALIVLNLVYYLVVELNGTTDDIGNMVRWGAAYTPYILGYHEYWRLLTAVFMHFSISHIANNMLVLFILGDNLERALGHVKYLIFYLVCGVGANIFSMLIHINEASQAVGAGASGAIFGVIGGLLWAVIRNKGHLEELSTGRLAIMAVYSIYAGFLDGNVDNAAHIGGLLIGFILSMLMYHPKKRTGWQEAYTE